MSEYFFEPIQLLSVTGFVHWRAAGAFQLRVGRHGRYRVLKLDRAFHVAMLAEVFEPALDRPIVMRLLSVAGVWEQPSAD